MLPQIFLARLALNFDGEVQENSPFARLIEHQVNFRFSEIKRKMADRKTR